MYPFRNLSEPSALQEERQSSDMRHRCRRYARCVLATVLVFVLLGPVPARTQVPLVELALVERRDIVETLRLTGSLTSPHTARLAPDFEGRLVSVEVDAGARVKAGDTLLKLDDELARLELAQAIAAEHQAEADLADAERRVLEVQELVAKNQ